MPITTVVIISYNLTFIRFPNTYPRTGTHWSVLRIPRLNRSWGCVCLFYGFSSMYLRSVMHWSFSIPHVPMNGGCTGLFYGFSIPPCTYVRGMHWSVLLISISHIPTSGGCNGLFYGVSIPNVPSPEDTLVCFTGFQLPCTYGRGIHFHEQYNKYICLILSSIYIFIPVSGWVVRDPSTLLCPGAYNAVKTALVSCKY